MVTPQLSPAPQAVTPHCLCVPFPQLFGELLERIKDDAADLLDVTIEFVAVVVGASAYMRINAGLLRWASHADHWRRLRSSGVERVGRACVAVSERIGQPLTPDMTPAMQVREVVPPSSSNMEPHVPCLRARDRAWSRLRW